MELWLVGGGRSGWRRKEKRRDAAYWRKLAKKDGKEHVLMRKSLRTSCVLSAELIQKKWFCFLVDMSVFVKTAT